MGTLQQRVSDRPPPGVRKPHFYVRPIPPDYLGEGRRQSATLYDATKPNNYVPIVEIWAVEKDRRCDVMARCYDPRHADWFRWLFDISPTTSPVKAVDPAQVPEKRASRLRILLTSLRSVMAPPAKGETEKQRHAPAPAAGRNADSSPGREASESPSIPASGNETETNDDPAKPRTKDEAASPIAESSAEPSGLPPGVKGLTEDEIKALRERSVNRDATVSIADFCDEEGISPTTFRKYVPKSMRHPRAKRNSDANSDGDPGPRFRR